MYQAGASGLPVALISQVTYGCAMPPNMVTPIAYTTARPVLRTSLRNDSVRHTSATPTLVELSALSRAVASISVSTSRFSTIRLKAG